MSSLPPDPYKALGVSKDAQITEIRAAHRKLVLKCHPDKVQDPTLKAQKADEFQKVQQAYELLSDEKERQKYDEQVKLAELREQFRAKANTSAPRATTARYSPEFDVHTAEPRPYSYKSQSTPNAKTTYTYSRSWEDNVGDSRRTVDAEFRGEFRVPRREASYSEAPRPSKRDIERERERDLREREREAKERDREVRERERDALREREIQKERRKRAKELEADNVRRMEKEAKEARRAEKKQREKLKEKELRREAEEKKRHAKPYYEPYDDEVPAKTEKKKSSSKKHEEKRERDGSLHRDEVPPPTSMPAPMPSGRSYENDLDYAASYIEAARAKNVAAPGLQRAQTFAARVNPPAPTPPPAQNSAFAAPGDDDPHRSATRPRRQSADGPRDKSYRTREFEPQVVDVSPSARYGKASATPMTHGSPPRRDLPVRTKTMPVEPAYSRPIPGLSRAQTFNGASPEHDPRGRGRSKMQPQVLEEDSDSEDYDDRKHRKHRSSKKHRSLERKDEYVRRYQVDGNSHTTKPINPYGQPETYEYHPSTRVRVVEGRHAAAPREANYATGTKFPKFKESKTYGIGDVQYSNYGPYRDDAQYVA